MAFEPSFELKFSYWIVRIAWVAVVLTLWADGAFRHVSGFSCFAVMVALLGWHEANKAAVREAIEFDGEPYFLGTHAGVPVDEEFE